MGIIQAPGQVLRNLKVSAKKWRFPNLNTRMVQVGLRHRDSIKSIIGNYYAESVSTSSWDAAQYAADHLEQLERQMRAFTRDDVRASIDSFGGEGGSKRQPFHPRDDDLLSNRGRGVPWV